MNNFKNINHLWCTLIIDQLIKSDINHFFINPGLRNAPLIQAIEAHPLAHLYAHHDERAQSFRALGYAKAKKKAAVLVCTSGTAVSNYFPSVIEAKKTKTPLIILSADRPNELIHGNANQTIDQLGIFGHYTKSTLNLNAPSFDFPPSALASQVAWTCQQANDGVIHINIPLREPLDLSKKEIPETYQEQAKHLIREFKHQTLGSRPLITLTKLERDQLQKTWNQAKSPLFIVGEMPVPTKDELTLWKEFFKKASSPFFLDITSNLKFSFGLEDGLIPSFDHPEVWNTFEDNPPDLIVHLGGRCTGKKYQQFLAKNKNIPIWQINQSCHRQDPANAINLSIQMPPTEFLKMANELFSPKNNPFKKEAISHALSAKARFIDDGPLCYPSITKASIENLKREIPLFIGNSTFIRSFDSYSASKMHINPPLYTQRGASGIEGHVAGACGISLAHKLPVIAFMGDISFLYDATSLQHVQDSPYPLLIVIANNHGGGIFDLLPLEGMENHINYMRTPYKIDLHKLVQAYHLSYESFSDIQEFTTAFINWQDRPETKIIELNFSNEVNAKVYQTLRTIK
jgi:2-succinyl-5-enolpyruvyl-6-hydroxy-3-cyclohexene-1-carboxylate synthase